MEGETIYTVKKGGQTIRKRLSNHPPLPKGPFQMVGADMQI